MGRRYEGDRARPVWDRQKGRWCVEVYRDGRRVRVSCPPGATEADACRQAKRLAADLRSKRLDAPATWDEAIEAFQAHRSSEGDQDDSNTTLGYRLRAVRATLGEATDPLALRTEDARRHVEARLEAGRSPVTIGAELAAIVELQRWAVAQGWIPIATWAGVKRPDTSRLPPREHLLPSEVGPFLRAAIGLGARADDDWTMPAWARWPAAAALLVHGARTGELRRLRCGHFDFGHPGIVIAYVRSTSSGRAKSRSSQRPIVIASAEGCAILRAVFEGRPPDEVCFSSIRHPGAELPARTHWFRDRVEATCEHAGIRRVATHGLRHSTATLLAALPGAGGLRGAQSVLGHGDERQTQRYAHADVGSRLAPSGALGEALDASLAGRSMFRVIKGGRDGSTDEAVAAPRRRRA